MQIIPMPLHIFILLGLNFYLICCIFAHCILTALHCKGMQQQKQKLFFADIANKI